MKTTTNSKETDNDNIPLTARNMEVQAPKHPRPPKACREIKSEIRWSDSEEGKDNQARSNPIDIPSIQDPQPGTSYARDSAPFRCPNTYPKI